jgi:TRAP-type C4-dicarboxylate transport system, periplasmic component
MGDLVVPYFPDQFPLNNVISFHLPQPNSPLELAEMMATLHQTYPQFDQELERYNLRLIGLRPLGYYGILCTQPVESLADLQGRRIRPFSVGSAAVLTSLGAVPVQMSTVETYEALQRGVLDCTAIEPVIAHGQLYDEVAHHYVDIPLGASWGQFIVINTSVYDGLPDDLRSVLDTLGQDYHIYFTQEQERLTAEVMDMWAAQDDFTITTISVEDLLAVTESDPGIAAVRQQWAERGEAAGLPVADIVSGLSY